jgi:hypothetical protein
VPVVRPVNEFVWRRLHKATSNVACILSHVHPKPHTEVWFGGYQKHATADVNQRYPSPIRYSGLCSGSHRFPAVPACSVATTFLAHVAWPQTRTRAHITSASMWSSTMVILVRAFTCPNLRVLIDDPYKCLHCSVIVSWRGVN